MNNKKVQKVIKTREDNVIALVAKHPESLPIYFLKYLFLLFITIARYVKFDFVNESNLKFKPSNVLKNLVPPAIPNVKPCNEEMMIEQGA